MLGPELHASDITWHLQPFTPEPADDDPLVAAILEGMAYRSVLSQAFVVIHELHRQQDRLREQHRRVTDEYRALRERLIEAAQ